MVLYSRRRQLTLSHAGLSKTCDLPGSFKDFKKVMRSWLDEKKIPTRDSNLYPQIPATANSQAIPLSQANYEERVLNLSTRDDVQVEILVYDSTTDSRIPLTGHQVSLVNKFCEAAKNQNPRIYQQLSPANAVDYVQAAGWLAQGDEGSDRSFWMSTLIAMFREITTKRVLYKTMIALSERKSQHMLDTIQRVLDSSSTSALLDADRAPLKKLMLRIADVSKLCPSKILIPLGDVEKDSIAVARGGFGEVFRGTYHGKHNVAIKVIKIYHTSDKLELRRKAWREAITWGDLEHENVLPFYGAYLLEISGVNNPCLVSPWMENGSVTAYLKSTAGRSRAPTYDDRRLLIKDVASGLKYLHEKEIIHGDIKGENVLITNSLRACLADFGLSKVSNSAALRWTSLSPTSTLGGTQRWKAPELLQNGHSGDQPEPTIMVDIYSFAGVCYQILTEKVPFYETDNDYEISNKVLQGLVPSNPLQSNAKDTYMTKALWCMMEKCWSLDPASRPSAREILDDKALSSLHDERKRPSAPAVSPLDFRHSMLKLLGGRR